MKLTVRPMTAADVPGYVDYVTKLPKSDSDRMGLAVDMLPAPAKLHADLVASLAQPPEQAKSFVLVWCVDGIPVGHSSLKDIIPGEQGGMHLHMWRADLRGQGIGPRLFCMAALEFYERFHLKTIVCEPKATNPMPNRMLQKIGFPLAKTFVGASSELSVVCELNQYVIDPAIAASFLERRT